MTSAKSAEPQRIRIFPTFPSRLHILWSYGFLCAKLDFLCFNPTRLFSCLTTVLVPCFSSDKLKASWHSWKAPVPKTLPLQVGILLPSCLIDRRKANLPFLSTCQVDVDENNLSFLLSAAEATAETPKCASCSATTNEDDESLKACAKCSEHVCDKCATPTQDETGVRQSHTGV